MSEDRIIQALLRHRGELLQKLLSRLPADLSPTEATRLLEKVLEFCQTGNWQGEDEPKMGSWRKALKICLEEIQEFAWRNFGAEEFLMERLRLAQLLNTLPKVQFIFAKF